MTKSEHKKTKYNIENLLENMEDNASYKNTNTNANTDTTTKNKLIEKKIRYIKTINNIYHNSYSHWQL